LLAARVFLGLALLWAVLALAWQARAARGVRRVDFSRPAGSRLRGLRYAFTGAMAPRHKETIRLHPIEFGIGLLLHAGVGIALVGVAFTLAGSAFGMAWLRALRPVLGLTLLGGIALFVRRIVSRNLRAISNLDDHLAILATCGLLALAGIASAPLAGSLLLYSGGLLLYLPFGKLRHVLFCPVARGEVGLRLGYRGVYPPPRPREATGGAGR
jgi:nitrate reductase gamma subunit